MLEVDANITKDLLEVEGNLLTSIINGPDALEDFLQSWSALKDRTVKALGQCSLDGPTISLAQSVAQSVTKILDSFIAVEDQADIIQSSLLTEVEGQLRTLTNRPTPLKQSRLDKSTKEKKPTEEEDLNHPGDVSLKFLPCKQFFLANFSSPYPTLQQKKVMIQGTELTIKSVTDWFTNMRRRSGWSAIMKEHAGNDKTNVKLLIDRVLRSPSVGSHPPLNTDVTNQVLIVKKYMEDLMKEEVSPIFEEVMRMKPKSDEEVKAWMEQKALARRKKGGEKAEFVRAVGTVEVVPKSSIAASNESPQKRKRTPDENSPPKRKLDGEEVPASGPSEGDRPSKRARSSGASFPASEPMPGVLSEGDRPAKRARIVEPVVAVPQTHRRKKSQGVLLFPIEPRSF
jgi:hypothetical protein